MRNKSLKTILYCMIAMVFCSALTFSACGSESEDNATEGNTLTFAFDSYDQMRKVSLQNCQAKAATCSEKEMHTEGKASMKLTVIKPATYEWHRYSETRDFLSPVLKLPLEETDLSETAAFTLDVYNDNTYDSGMYLYAVDVNGDVIFNVYDEAYSKAWTKLSFPVNQAFVSGKINEIYLSIADTNENTTYYLDNFHTYAGKTAPITAKAKGNVLSSLSTAEELYSLNAFTTTDYPAFHVELATDPVDGTKTTLALTHENYNGGQNSISHTTAGRLYGIRLAESVIEDYDFSTVGKCSVEVYNAMPTPKKVSITLGNETEELTQETEVPVGEWTKIFLEIPETGFIVKEVSVTMRSYDNFRAGTVYLRNLLTEGK